MIHPTPYYIVRESAIKRNLNLIDKVGKEAGVEFVMALKANALWPTFHILREYGFGFAASSLNELRLGYDNLHKRGHTYCLAYKTDELDDFLRLSSHLTFNSLSQWYAHEPFLIQWNEKHKDKKVSPGLRVNPHCSVVKTDIYNPARPGSRFGVSRNDLGELPKGIEGLHFHQLCESTSYDLEAVLEVFEESFGHIIPHLKWVNMGGGHLLTRDGYDVEHLIKVLKSFRERYSGIKVILEPGSAFMWDTGDLVTSVMDIVSDSGITTAIIDASFTCHMPDTLEMPYHPEIKEAYPEIRKDKFNYNIGGNSCLSGDFKGPWSFEDALKIGDRLTFRDMNHYTNVKTTMFNGLSHPDILLEREDGTIELLRHYDYEDYKSRMG